MQAVVERGWDVAAEDAQRELTDILQAIGTERGMPTAHAAAVALRTAASEGTIDGVSYVYKRDDTYYGCAMAHLGLAIDGETTGKPDLPGWSRSAWRDRYEVYSPLERWVEAIRPGHIAASVPDLARLVEWCDGWMAAHPAA